MKSLLKYLKPYKKLLILGPAFKLSEAVLELMLPFLMSKAVDIGVANADKAYILKIGVIMLLTALVGIACALICQYSASLVSQGIGTDIRNAMFHKIGTLSNAQLDAIGTSSLVNRITNDVNQVQLAVAMLIRLVIRAPFLCIGGLAMAFMIDPRLSVIMVIVLPVFIFILFLTMTKTIPLYKKVQRKLDGISVVLRENLSGVRVIRAFSKMEDEKKRFARQNKEYEESAVRVGRISALLNPLTSLIMNGSIGAILWYGGIRVYDGATSPGEIIAFIGYMTQILAALIVISNLVVIFTKAFASASRISQVLAMEGDIQDGNASESSPSTSDIAVEFKDVSMTYAKDSEYDIDHISFQVKRGETIGIIGGTGSGKSTVVNMIPRFYDAARGRVLVDGKDVRDYPVAALRAKIGMVPQKSVLFTGTIADNIRWGKEDATEEEIILAAERAQALEFIKKMPDGFQTKISRGGVNVSGGQRQRLGIARAFVRQPEILILDDSFNALDFLTDARLRAAIKEYAKEMTTFIVSQRASTIKDADRILVFHDGALVGSGTHEELYGDCGIYREICQSQQQNQGKEQVK